MSIEQGGLFGEVGGTGVVGITVFESSKIMVFRRNQFSENCSRAKLLCA